MTNKEAVIAEVQLGGYSDSAIEKAFIDMGLSQDDTYIPLENARNVAQIAIKVLGSMLGTKSVTEGGYSITYSITERITALNEQSGLLEIKKPTITYRALW